MSVIVRDIRSAYGKLVNSARKNNNADKLANVKKPARAKKVVYIDGKSVVSGRNRDAKK